MIITCPYCKFRGEKRNLGELIEGGVKILRNNNGEIDFTIVKSKDFEIICGTCLNTVIYTGFKPIMPQFNVLLAWGTIMSYYAKGSY